jgi:hypothetical protein
MGEIFNAPFTETTTIWEVNQSVIAYSQNALVSVKTKHIGMKWHFLKDHEEHGTIKLRYMLIPLRRAANGQICTLDSGGVLALHT